jgi:hypothetical protein
LLTNYGILNKMNESGAEAKIPLNYRDRQALEEMFEKIELEEMSQVEALATRFWVIPLEPWEEQGWIVNSSFARLKQTIEPTAC